MKQCVVLMMAFLCVHGAPVDVLTPGSCQDAVASGAAAEAMNKINLDRTEGYVFSLDRLTNVHYMKHGESGIVFYLTFDVLETKCHVISKKNWKNCEIRNPEEYPVYGQCKAVMYMNRVHRVTRLYKYSCTVRQVPASKIRERCPDCPVQLPEDHEAALKTVKMGMEKYNKESALANYFAPLNITKLDFGRFYSVEFTIQETVCSSKTNIADVSKCEVMGCKFAHKGFCKVSHSVTVTGEENLSVQCEIFEPETAEEEKKKHLIGVRRPDGMVNVLPPVDKPMTLPSFPDKPAAGPEQPSTLPFHPDPQIPGQREPAIHPFPNGMSPECPAQSNIQNGLLKQIISEDPLFKPTV
ncbi:antihemorrhagic factor cHLP-B-like protein [Labeo rohita]|uniref:Antihemorrhagic factor cHLP-B-like protein n=1 Tax=Labeo rohita TaxID=84645 RepID=A0A498N1N7_LABRO|nr:antihemorrhagic factor cHLP-B-like protein [Labeo rohita]